MSEMEHSPKEKGTNKGGGKDEKEGWPDVRAGRGGNKLYLFRVRGSTRGLEGGRGINNQTKKRPGETQRLVTTLNSINVAKMSFFKGGRGGRSFKYNSEANNPVATAI